MKQACKNIIMTIIVAAMALFALAVAASRVDAPVPVDDAPPPQPHRTPAFTSDTVVFHDDTIENEVRYYLDKEAGSISVEDMDAFVDWEFMSINGECRDIQDIITYFPNLNDLSIYNYTGNEDVLLTLGTLPRLKRLSLDYPGGVLDLDDLLQYRQLEYLSIDAAQISIGDPGTMSKLDNLETVCFKNAILPNLGFITNIPNIQKVALMECSIADVSPAINMELNQLVITCDPEAEPSSLACLPGIEGNSYLESISLENGILNGYAKMADDNHVFEVFITPNKIDEDTYRGQFYSIIVEDRQMNPIQMIPYAVRTDEYSVSLYPSLEKTFYLLDVNFDGFNDILILTGYYGTQGAACYTCWLWDAGTGAYIQNDSFSDIPNVSIDRDSHRVLGCWRNWAASHSWAMYQYIDGEFVMTSMLTIEAIWDDTLSEEPTRWQYTDERLIDGQMQIYEQFTVVIPGKDDDKVMKYRRESGYWDLYGDQWQQLDNGGLLVDFSIYARSR